MNKLLLSIRREFLVELRSFSSVYLPPLFGMTLVTALSLASPVLLLTADTRAALFVVILYFSLSLIYSTIFSRDYEKKTVYFLKNFFTAENVYFSKFVFCLFSSVCTGAAVSLTLYFFSSVTRDMLVAYFVFSFAGSLALAASSMLTGALTAATHGKGGLFMIISLPFHIPALAALLRGVVSYELHGEYDGGIMFFLLAFSFFQLSAGVLLYRILYKGE